MNLDASENLESDEESGKSWSELEEEARRGNDNFSIILFISYLFTADAEKLEYDSDNGGRNKKKGGSSSASRRRPPVVTKKRPAPPPPSNNNKKRKK